jgi:hypothetical protein
MKIFVFAVLAGTLLSIQGRGQAADKPQTGKETSVFATELYFSKGGLGVIDENLYIDLKSPKNELLLKDGKRWTGKVAGAREVVMFFEDRIWSSSDLPNGFDLSKSAVVSFEGDIVRFFRFTGMSGGYYERLPAK